MVVAKTVEKFNQIDVVVNNVAYCQPVNNENFHASDSDKSVNVSIKLAAVITEEAVPHLKKTKGNIVNVCSVFGVRLVRQVFQL